MQTLFKDLRIYLSTVPLIWCDNISSIAIASNPVFQARTKHLECDYRYVSEKVVHKELDVRYINIVDQIADIFTKGLTSAHFQIFRFKLMICPQPIRLQGSNEDNDKDDDSAPVSSSVSTQS